jgi:adenosylhomocysteine nucleosidase
LNAAGSRAAGGIDAVVLAALPEEMQPLQAMLTDVRRPIGDETIWCGRCADRSVALVVTGDGERNARTGAFTALRGLHPRAVLAIGVSGALSPELAVGDLLIGHQVMREQGEAWPASPSLLAAAEALDGAFPAALISAPRLAVTRADKRRLAAVAADRAQGLPAAVDLESAAFASEAAARGLPWLFLRAVSDGADEELPPLLNDCLDDGGSIQRGRLAARLFGQPSALPRLLVLHRRTRVCAETLAKAVATLLAGPLDAISQEDWRPGELGG